MRSKKSWTPRLQIWRKCLKTTTQVSTLIQHTVIIYCYCISLLVNKYIASFTDRRGGSGEVPSTVWVSVSPNPPKLVSFATVPFEFDTIYYIKKMLNILILIYKETCRIFMKVICKTWYLLNFKSLLIHLGKGKRVGGSEFWYKRNKNQDCFKTHLHNKQKVQTQSLDPWSPPKRMQRIMEK